LRKDARRVANLDFDARVPIPFSVFPSSYRSDAANHHQPAPVPVSEPEPVAYPVEHHHHDDSHSLVDREDTRTAAPALPDPAVYGKEEIPQEFVNHQ